MTLASFLLGETINNLDFEDISGSIFIRLKNLRIPSVTFVVFSISKAATGTLLLSNHIISICSITFWASLFMFKKGISS